MALLCDFHTSLWSSANMDNELYDLCIQRNAFISQVTFHFRLIVSCRSRTDNDTMEKMSAKVNIVIELVHHASYVEELKRHELRQYQQWQTDCCEHTQSFQVRLSL